MRGRFGEVRGICRHLANWRLVDFEGEVVYRVAIKAETPCRRNAVS